VVRSSLTLIRYRKKLTMSSSGSSPYRSPLERSSDNIYDVQAIPSCSKNTPEPEKVFHQDEQEIDYATMSLDEIMKRDNGRLNAIFSIGSIIYESRLDDQPSYSYQPEVLMDTAFKNENNKQENVVPEAACEVNADSATFVFAGQTFCSERKPSLLQYIQNISDGPPKYVKVFDVPLVLPNIVSQNTHEVLSAVESYQQILLTNIEASDCKRRKVERENTLQQMKKKIQHVTNKLSRLRERSELYGAMAVARVLELIAQQQEHKFSSLIQFQDLSTKSVTTGIFVHMDSMHTKTIPRESLITESILGAPATCIYNLSYNQLNDLIQVCFSKDVSTRVKAKISLLSSVKENIRSEIALQPIKVLERSFLEHYLDREEIISLIFCQIDNRSQKVYQCPHCRLFVQCDIHNVVVHSGCPVTKWLCEKYGYIEVDGRLQIPGLMYLNPPIATYARALIKANTERRLNPVSLCDDDLTSKAPNGESQAHGLAHQEVKPNMIHYS
jgi:hypothetical protein